MALLLLLNDLVGLDISTSRDTSYFLIQLLRLSACYFGNLPRLSHIDLSEQRNPRILYCFFEVS